MPRKSLPLFAVAVAGGFLFGRASAQPADESKARVFEIRTYTTLPGRLDALHARFRDHTVKLFKKHGITNVGYWVPTEGEKAGNTLIYILAHDSRDAAKKSFAEFGQDPEWQKARAASEADGKIVEKIESVFVTPTDYSPLR